MEQKHRCDIYGSPSKCGLVKLYEMDRGMCFEFDITLALWDPRAYELFVVKDSGCSCPYPFKGYSCTNINMVPKHAMTPTVTRAVEVMLAGRETEGDKELMERLASEYC